MNLFKSELTRVLRNKLIYFSIGIIMMSSIISIVKRMHVGGYNYDWLEIFLSTHGFGTETILPITLPLLVCIPYTATFYEDISTKYINFLVSRSSIKKYLAIKIFFNAIIPMIIITFNIVLNWIVSMMLFKNSIGDLQGVMYNQIFVKLINDNKIGMFIISIIGISVVFACVFTSLGLVITVFVKNKHISVISPFLAYIITGVIALTIDKIYLHMGTIFTGYLYENTVFIISLVIGLIVILLSNLLFYIKLSREGF